MAVHALQGQRLPWDPEFESLQGLWPQLNYVSRGIAWGDSASGPHALELLFACCFLAVAAPTQ